MSMPPLKKPYKPAPDPNDPHEIHFSGEYHYEDLVRREGPHPDEPKPPAKRPTIRLYPDDPN